MTNERLQHWSAADYERNAAFVPALGNTVLELLDPQAGEAILDLGCGDGALTIELVKRGARVVGVDAAPELVAVARARGLHVRLADAQRLDDERAFDAVFSNAALHWMPDHDAVLAGVYRALRPGGRFVAELGGHGNVASIVVALGAALARRGLDVRDRSPWYFPTVEAYRRRLQRSGFRGATIASHPRPTRLPTDMRGWLQTFAAPFFAGFTDAERAAATDEAIALLEPALAAPDGAWTADYVRLRFRAFKDK